jgi:hypothetical protein
MSPLLFVLAVDLLQCIINKAHVQGLLQLPIPSYDNVGFFIIQYADDTIIDPKRVPMSKSSTRNICSVNRG